jgi:hypothetical protein
MSRIPDLFEPIGILYFRQAIGFGVYHYNELIGKLISNADLLSINRTDPFLKMAAGL